MTTEKDLKIKFIGQVYGQTGYNIHSYQLAKALYDEGVDLKLETNLPPDFPKLAEDWIYESVQKQDDEDRTVIFIGMPQFWKSELLKNPKNFIGYVVWEGDKIPRFWLPYLANEKVKQIWVPSKHVKNAILQTVLDTKTLPKAIQSFDVNETSWNKIKIVPHGVDASIFNPGKKKNFKDDFVFVANKGWRLGDKDRGGLQFVLKAFNEEFNVEEKVKLLVKINTVYSGQNWNLNDEMKKIDIINKNNIFVTADNLLFSALRGLYVDGDVFVTASMAEAFNMPCLEAMACQLPCISTDFGGMTDYINEDNGWLIDGSMIDVDWDYMYEGVKWQYPNINKLKKTMRYVFEHQDEVKKKGLKALKDAQKLTWKNSVKIGIRYINNL